MVKNLKKFLKWFTLIELIIVIWIVALLSTWAYLMLMKWMSKWRDARKIADINTLSKWVLIYELENFGFPTPSNAISLTDQYWEEIGKQWLFDKAVVDKLSSIHKTVKDPFTNEYYSYTTYDKHRWFEIWTFIESMGKISFNINSKTYADDEDNINPYVFVYWKVKVCEDNWVIKYPNPVSVYDENKYKYVSTKTMWNAWKVMFNMKYLNGSKKALEWSGTVCDSEVQAPIIWFQSYNTWMNLKQTNKEEIIGSNDGLIEIIQQECEHNNLCNSPDIFRVRYNFYILTYYNPVTKEITLIEAEYNVDTGKFEKKSKQVIYNGSWTSADRWKIYWIANGSNWMYQVYYGWWSGWVQVFTQWWSGWWWSVGWISVLWWAWSSYDSMQLHWWASITEWNNQSLVTFSKEWTTEGYIARVLGGDGTASTIVTKLPFECKMPKIIYLSEDVYLIVYIDENGNMWVNKVTYSAWSSSPTIEDYPVDWAKEDITNIDIEHIWKDLVWILITKSSWENVIKIAQITDYWLMNTDKDTIDTWSISDIQLVSWWKWDLNITYTKWTSSVSNYYKVSLDGFISLVNSTPLSWTNTKLSQIWPTSFVNILWWNPISINNQQNEPIKVVEDADEDDTKWAQILKVDGSWLSNTNWAILTNSWVKLWKVPTLISWANSNVNLWDSVTFTENFTLWWVDYLWVVTTPVVTSQWSYPSWVKATYYIGSTDTIKIYRSNWTSFESIQTLTWVSGTTSHLSYFAVDGFNYLAVSTVWNWLSWNSKYTWLYKWDWSQFVRTQSLVAWIWVKYFEIETNKYLIVNKWFSWNCSTVTGRAVVAGAIDCKLTYGLWSQMYKWNWTNFATYWTISIPSNSIDTFANNTEFFQIDWNSYISIWTYTVKNTYWNNYIYKWDGSKFNLYQTILWYNLYSSKYFERNWNKYLLVMSYGNTWWLFKRDWSQFVLYQNPFPFWMTSFDTYENWIDLYLVSSTRVRPSSIIDGKRVYDSNVGFIYLYKWNGDGFDLVLNNWDRPNSFNSNVVTIWWKNYLIFSTSQCVSYFNNYPPGSYMPSVSFGGYFGFYHCQGVKLWWCYDWIVYEIWEQAITNNIVVLNVPETAALIIDRVGSINDVIIDEERPEWTDIKYLVSFNNKQTFMTKSSWSWEVSTDAEIKTKWMSSEQLRQALIDFDKDTRESFVKTDLDGRQKIYLKVWLETTNPELSSSLKSIKVIYNKILDY